MANIRTTVTGVGGKYPSRTPGTRAGLQVNSFGLKKLQGISGNDLAPIVLRAMEPAFEQAQSEWPVLTGASRDSMDLSVTEVGPKHARVALQAGGPKLIADNRNKSKKDYAPFIEYLGTSTTPAGTMTHAVISNEETIKEGIREGLRELIRRRLGA